MQAEFEAKVAQVMADIATREAKTQIAETELGAEFDQAALEAQKAELQQHMSDGMEAINMLTAEFMGAAGEMMDDIRNRETPVTPKVARVRAKRVNGVLVAIPEYEGENSDDSGSDQSEGAPGA